MEKDQRIRVETRIIKGARIATKMDSAVTEIKDITIMVEMIIGATVEHVDRLESTFQMWSTTMITRRGLLEILTYQLQK
jgi:hypothetical protein